jgi:hypothetical protein
MSLPVACVRRGPLAGTTVRSGTPDACLNTFAPFLVVCVVVACRVVGHEGRLGAVGWILAVRVVNDVIVTATATASFFTRFVCLVTPGPHGTS